MKQNIKEILAGYGMNDKEVKIYLALLGSGSATAKQLASLTKIKRTSIYPLADRLVAKGILGIYKAKYGTHYTATSPLSLVSRLERIKDNLKKALPELEAMQMKDTHEANVKFYRGKEGYITILDETLSGYSQTIYYIGSSDDLTAVISEQYANKYIAERVKRNTKFKQLVFRDKFTQNALATDAKELRQTRFLPADYKFTGNMVIYNDKVAYFSSIKELSCVLIQSPEIADMERGKFKLIWDRLK